MSVSWMESDERSPPLIVVRCKGCGKSLSTWKMRNIRGYSEELSDKPCTECTGKVTTAEAKLLKAIFGET